MSDLSYGCSSLSNCTIYVASVFVSPFFEEFFLFITQSASNISGLISIFCGTVTSCKLKQPLKALSPISVIPLPMVIEVKPLQPLNASESILVTLSGMVISDKLWQFSNAWLPIDVTLFGIVIEVNLGQLTNI